MWGLLNATAVKDEHGAIQAVIGQVQDITARKEAEAALRESEARFRALIQNDPDVILIIDDTMAVVYISPSATAALGVSPDKVLGPFEPNLRLVHPADRGATSRPVADVGGRSGAAASVEARIRHRELGWRWFQFTVANLLDDPGIEGYLFNLRDITDRKQAELATEAALEAQQTAIERAGAAQPEQEPLPLHDQPRVPHPADRDHWLQRVPRSQCLRSGACRRRRGRHPPRSEPAQPDGRRCPARRPGRCRAAVADI